jgi:uncharacterized protein (TIGR03435 family)
MLPPIDEVLLAVGSSPAASVVAKVSVIVALALFAAWLARGSRAAVRHAFLAAAFGVTLLLPIASVLVPPVHLGLPVVVENPTSALPLLASSVEQTPPVLMTNDPGHPVIAAPQSSRISLSHLLLAGWIAGGAIFVLPVVIGLWQIHLLRRSGLPWRRGQSLADRIAPGAGVHRRVEVLLHEELPGPMTCGIVHPAIVLPQDAESWNEEDLTRAFTHELEHVRRCDSLSRSLARSACAVYWFHPLVWIAWRKLALEAERSCDDAVLRRSEATAYADQLVGLAQRLSAAQRSPLLAMANRADLATRVRAVLDARQRRGRAGAFSLGLATAAAMALVLSMSSLILVATPQAAPAQTATAPAFDKVQGDRVQRDAVQGEQPHEKPNPPRLVAQAVTPAQPPASQPKLEFEVASVRRVDIQDNPRGVPVFPPTGGIGTSDPTHYAWHGAWLVNFMTQAFGVRADQIDGAAYLKVRTERYDVVANIPAGATQEQFNAMLGNLLRDRFHMRFHMDSKVIPVYALRVGKNGPKFKETARRTGEPTAPVRVGGDRDAQGFIVVPPEFKGMLSWPVPGEMFTTAQDVTMAELARTLESPVVGRPIIDETGLTGHYDFKIRFHWAGRSTTDSGADSDPAPSVFTAVEDQLGLKLESSTHSFPQLVVDSIDRDPTEN